MQEIRKYGRVENVLPIPDLLKLQTLSYARFLQNDVTPTDRKNHGLQAILKEIFPIKSLDGSMSLEFLWYELGRPRYTREECWQLRLTYGYPFKIRVRLDKEEPIEEDVYLGEVPIMVGGGEFIINGAERVIVSQLHRSPGIDFAEEIHPGDRKLHQCWIIPERGSWIELAVSKRETISIKIDQSGKFSALTFLRALSPEFSTNAQILSLFYPTEPVSVKTRQGLKKVLGRHLIGDLVDAETGEVLAETGEILTEKHLEAIKESGIEQVTIIPEVDDPLILNSLAEDTASTHEEALLKIYGRLRPGNPPQLERARDLFREKFFDANRYRLGRVGRFRLNRKFDADVHGDVMTLDKDDILNAIRYLLKLRRRQGQVDDIDHLGNRRVRTIDELAGDEIRKGFLKLKRMVQERMNLDNRETLSPRSLINSKTISSAIEYFFGRGELSQVVDQTNPLAQLTHERRLSALGPGGLNRKRAGFEVRDVHISHYGRICPIETPEGTNIGLISSLGIYATVDEYGFLTTPYHVVKRGKLTNDVVFLRADEEVESILAPADTALGRNNKIIGEKVLARKGGDFTYVDASEVQYMDVSPKQLVGVSASLIPFLEHNDANRALMGSNMQRQAVPLLTTEPPIVGTGMEDAVAENSGMVVLAENDGTVTWASADEIVVDDTKYRLRKFVGLNDRTCLNQRPIVREGEKVKKHQVIADGAATSLGELALGKNILVAFIPWEGHNFEDAIIVNEDLVKRDIYTSIHIDEFEIEIRETRLGREEFTRDIPNVSEKALRNLNEDGIVRIGTKVKPGDILVGKVAPKSKSELSPEEKLLHAIFGRAGEDVKNDSLEVPSGVEGIVIDAQKFSRKVNLSEEERNQNRMEIKKAEKDFHRRFSRAMKDMLAKLEEALEGPITEKQTGRILEYQPGLTLNELRELKDRVHINNLRVRGEARRQSGIKIIREYADRIETAEDEKNRIIGKLTRGDELPTGVLEMVKVYVATKRTLSVGDKMAGRHGNKGVISKILAEEDMPFLETGEPVQILLNPLGVPSRMNLGQILETHLGWAAHEIGFRALTPIFDGCSESEIELALEEAGLPVDGKTTLFDGRTGAPFDQKVTVGYIYMMKLHHLVDDKVHARATGPYSLITQQPLGGKARFGGQRFGEMEVWALEAYGAAHILQELLTVKSDDVDGRTKIYEAMVKGENTLEPGTPVSFDVLT
ncbi:MAG: DNA-directed RNA polymerase subunit beta, partial [Planctomycetota bacterium]